MPAIAVDSTCNLDQELCSLYDITVIQQKSIIGKTIFNDWEIPPDDIYNAQKENIPTTTSAFNIGDSRIVFDELASKGNSAIALIISPKLSASYDVAIQAKETVNGKIDIINSGTTAMSLGLVAMKAAEYARNHNHEDTLSYIKEYLLPRTKLYASLTEFSQLHKSGRMDRIRFYAGSLLQIFPILSVIDGEVKDVARVRGANRIKEKIKDFISSDLDIYKPTSVDFMVAHGDCYERARELEYMTTELLSKAVVVINSFGIKRVTSVLGAHGGPTVHGIGLLYL